MPARAGKVHVDEAPRYDEKGVTHFESGFYITEKSKSHVLIYIHLLHRPLKLINIRKNTRHSTCVPFAHLLNPY